MDNQTIEVTFEVGQDESEYHQKLIALVRQGYQFSGSIVETNARGATRKVTIIFAKPSR